MRGKLPLQKALYRSNDHHSISQIMHCPAFNLYVRNICSRVCLSGLKVMKRHLLIGNIWRGICSQPRQPLVKWLSREVKTQDTCRMRNIKITCKKNKTSWKAKLSQSMKTLLTTFLCQRQPRSAAWIIQTLRFLTAIVQNSEITDLI